MSRALSATLSELEGFGFSIEVGQASGYETAKSITRRHPLGAAVRLALREQGAAKIVLQRIFELSTRAIDLRYASPYDAALLCLLLALHDVRARELPAALDAAVSAPNTWWARRVVAELQEADRSDAYTVSRTAVEFLGNRALMIETYLEPGNDSSPSVGLLWARGGELFVPDALVFSSDSENCYATSASPCLATVAASATSREAHWDG